VNSFTDSCVTITCGHCGKTSGFDRWTVRPVSGPLPKGQFQCPECGYAFVRSGAGKWKFLKNARGQIVDGYQDRVELKQVGAVL